MKKLRDAGELKLIEMFVAKYTPAGHTITGIGDDAAVVKAPGKGKHILFTCDTIVEGVHFVMNKYMGYEIGWKAMGAGLSDIAAMGGVPTSAVVSLAMPGNLSVGFVGDLVSGMNALARKFGVDVAGGDTVSSPHELMISVSVIGTVGAGKAVLRSGAKAGDKILVTGSLGGSIFKKQFNFLPRIKEAGWLVSHGRINAMMDITDGLSLDLQRLVTASNAGAVLYKELIPISKDAYKTRDAFASAVNDGEDFELLITTPDADKLVKNWHNKNVALTIIGQITNNKGRIELVDGNGKIKELAPRGYEHFK